MVGAVGTDAQALVGLEGLRAAGVDLAGVREVDGPTGLAIVTVAEDGENSIVVIAGANDAVDAAQVASARDVLAASAIVVCQGEIPREGIEALPDLVTGRFLHNPAPVMELDPEVLRASDPLVVNEHEAALVLAQLAPCGCDPRGAGADRRRAARGRGRVGGAHPRRPGIARRRRRRAAPDPRPHPCRPWTPPARGTRSSARSPWVSPAGSPCPPRPASLPRWERSQRPVTAPSPANPSAEDDLPPLAEVSA